jgi:putative endonuclease
VNRAATTNIKLSQDKDWVVYMILSSDQRIYTGITNNISQRWDAHCHKKTGAKFFRGRKPERLLYVEAEHNRSTASKRESAIKKLKKTQKIDLITTQKNKDWHAIFNIPNTISEL